MFRINKKNYSNNLTQNHSGAAVPQQSPHTTARVITGDASALLRLAAVFGINKDAEPLNVRDTERMRKYNATNDA